MHTQAHAGSPKKTFLRQPGKTLNFLHRSLIHKDFMNLTLKNLRAHTHAMAYTHTTQGQNVNKVIHRLPSAFVVAAAFAQQNACA
jgi:hypothetical protein